MQSLFPLYLFHFLIQIHEQARVEEILYRDPESVAQLFNCRDRCAVVAPADNVVDGRLRDAAHAAQLVDPFPDGLSDIHTAYALLFRKSINKRT